jgi:UDP-N-acetylglucosamine--N-acetylmuramyl-(pentapeptide) pyrophosphoryl-undecaprenol N-acetylglucosamine transferase
MRSIRIYFAGGGSGGHLFPGMSLAQAIRAREPAAEIRFLISGKKLDAALLAETGFSCHTIEQRHLPQHPRQLADFMVTNARAFWKLIRMMFRERPDVVVGLGGYASFAASAAAKLCAVPVVLLEQNVIPGKANRALALAADRVFCQWRSSARYFARRDNLSFEGNPVRESLQGVSRKAARRKLGLSLHLPTVLVLGGSQGARALNGAIVDALTSLNGLAGGFQAIHLAGQEQAEEVRNAYNRAGVTASVHGFMHEMQLAYSAANLVFCRAGGTTIAEVTAVGLPSVLVPLPTAAENHQLANARELAATGAARLLEEKDLQPQAVREAVFELLLDGSKLRDMANRAKEAAKPAAAKDIAETIMHRFKPREAKSLVSIFRI